jgi:hypothetical protein
MGTNYYKIPTAEEMENRKEKLIKQVSELDLSIKNFETGFGVQIENSWACETPWDVFINGSCIHLGKRSGGWKFCWNFHEKKYYTDKEELLEFIRSGRVVNEYGDEMNVDEFIEMALNWGEPDGHTFNDAYIQKERLKGVGAFWDDPRYYDLEIDGLRVSTSTDFS